MLVQPLSLYVLSMVSNVPPRHTTTTLTLTQIDIEIARINQTALIVRQLTFVTLAAALSADVHTQVVAILRPVDGWMIQRAGGTLHNAGTHVQLATLVKLQTLSRCDASSAVKLREMQKRM